MSEHFLRQHCSPDELQTLSVQILGTSVIITIDDYDRVGGEPVFASIPLAIDQTRDLCTDLVDATNQIAALDA